MTWICLNCKNEARDLDKDGYPYVGHMCGCGKTNWRKNK